MHKRKTKKLKKSNSRAARRKRLERATAAYYRSLSREDLKKENRLGAAMAWAASQVNFDE